LGDRTTIKAAGRRDSYGRLRRRRRRGAALLVVFALVGLVALLGALAAPDLVRQVTHPLEYEAEIRASAGEFGVEPSLVAAVIKAESRFDPEATSSQGAYGLMQLLPETARFVSERTGISGDFRDPETNIRIGTRYLSYLQSRYDGDQRLALAAYNSGEGRVDRWLSRGDFDVSRDIPFAETHDYVRNVTESQRVYEELYGENLDQRPGLLPGS
jgi:soluble lytic murein transglycosylase